MACSRSRTPSPRKTGARKDRRRSNITASRSTTPSRRCCGMANGKSPTSHSATWARPSWSALLGIYLLVVAQFGSFKLPLVILAPVPLTLIGIMLGHLLFNAAFTATSMIGFIALAGIVVRNSILLVDFIRHLREKGLTLRAALIEAGSVRFKPIFLTAAAAMIGAAFILTDPIFQGLAISLVFGLASSTALTLLVIPAIYVVLRDDEETPKR